MSRVTETQTSSPRGTLFAVAILVAAGLAVYSNSFTSLFVGLDGKESLRDNPHILHAWPPSEALSLPMWKPLPNMAEMPAVAHRPTFSLSLALTNRFLGTEPRMHHAVNIAIHIAAALVLFGIVRRTLWMHTAPGGAKSTWLALAAALIWLVHPLQTESVTYVVQRSESLMGLLFLLTLYAALRSLHSRHRLWWQLVAITACVAGAGCKQTGAFVPFLVILYDYTFAPRADGKWGRPVFYVLLIGAAWIGPLTYARKIGTYLDAQRFVSYALTQPAVILHYLKLSIWPDELYLYVNTHVFDVRSIAQVVIPAAVLVALFVGTLICIVRRHWLGFIGAWFFVTLGPTSSFLPISDVIQEHRMYVPLAAFAVLAVVGVDAGLRRFAPRLAESRRGAVEVAVLAVVVIAFGIRTYVRNWDYHHEFSAIHPADLHEDYTILADHYLSKPGLIEAEAARQRAMLRSADRDRRDVPFAHFIIALAEARRGELASAIAQFRRVLELEPDFAYAHHQFGIALREAGDATAAAEQFREAIRIEPKLVHAYKELAAALVMTGDTGAAEEQLQLALRMQPGFAEAFFERGMLALKRGDKPQAEQYFQEAIRIRPSLAEPYYELAMLYKEAGEMERAREQLAATVRLRPDFVPAHRELARLLESAGKGAVAVVHFKHVVRLQADLASTQANRAHLLRTQGDAAGAERAEHGAIRAERDLVEARHELARSLVRQEKNKQAVGQLRRAIGDLRRARAHPHAADTREELAALYTELGMAMAHQRKIDRAVPYLDEAIRLRPDSAQAHTELGIVLHARGEGDKAIEHLDEAIRLRPQSADAYKALGILLRDRGDLEGAAASFEAAVRLQPDFADAHKELGSVREQQGELRAAAEHFKRALEIRSDFPEARARLQDVEARMAHTDRPAMPR